MADAGANRGSNTPASSLPDEFVYNPSQRHHVDPFTALGGHECATFTYDDGCEFCWTTRNAVVCGQNGFIKCPRCNGTGMVQAGPEGADWCPTCPDGLMPAGYREEADRG